MTKPNRNNPCPCGSGKKYKKCCGLPTGKKPITASVLSSGSSSLASRISSLSSKVSTTTETTKEIQASK